MRVDRWPSGESPTRAPIPRGTTLSHHTSSTGSAKRLAADLFVLCRTLGSETIRGVLNTVVKRIGPSRAGSPKSTPLSSVEQHARLRTLRAGSDPEFDADEQRVNKATVPPGDLTFQEFMEACFDYEPQRRRGWAISEMLRLARADLLDSVEGTALDPRDDDSRIKACLDWVEFVWEQ